MYSTPCKTVKGLIWFIESFPREIWDFVLLLLLYLPPDFSVFPYDCWTPIKIFIILFQILLIISNVFITLFVNQ